MGDEQRAKGGSVAGLVSVIVPCFGRSTIVRRCLSALFRHTRRPEWELVAVTRRDDDRTAAYLAGLADAARSRVEIVSDSEVRDRYSAWRRGLSIARGELVALLSPSVIVTDAWLEQLVALVSSDLGIVLAGPMSNAAAAPQRAEGPETGDLAAVDSFSQRWRAVHLGGWFVAEILDGHCVVVRRTLLDSAEGRHAVCAEGLRPRRLGIRARRAGGQAAVAYDLYVHREAGSKAPRDAGREEGSHVEAIRTSLPRRAVRVSLTMIVRNEEKNLPACLGSATGLFDEIVVVDTGSTDRTVEIARSFGAKVSEFTWIDDFAAARNAALSRATGDYAFWLDADDVLDLEERPKLSALLDRLSLDNLSAYVVRCACDPDRNGGGGRTVVDHVRLFPLRDDIRWCYRVHEQILPAVRRAGVPVQWTDVVVRHTGYTDPALRSRKLHRDQLILERELGERPDDPFVLFNLGSISIERLEWRAALGYFARSLSGSSPGDSITRKLFALISRCHQMLDENELALRACVAGLEADPEDAELLFRKGVLHRIRGEDSEAETCWRKIMKLRRPEQFSSLDEGIYGHLTRRNLAALAEGRGDLEEAMRLWSEVLEECPADQEAIFKRNHITLRRREHDS